MKAIILAAGYATRLYPITRNKPKCFIEYNHKRVIDYILDDIRGFVDEIIIVTNDKFYSMFKECYPNITLLSDHTTCNENRLGAGNDLIYTLKELKIKEECIVLASDNLYTFSLKRFIEYYYLHKTSCLMYYVEGDMERLKRTGVVHLNYKQDVIRFIEKPNDYISSYAVPPAYIFNKKVVNQIKSIPFQDYDSPGCLIEELCKSTPFKAYKMKGKRVDIGSKIE